MYGGSTGGWEVLGQQIFYPDDFNGTWSFCPGAVDSRQYEMIDIYDDDNAYYLMEDFLESTREPYYAGHIEYGDRYEHCWTGVHGEPLRIQGRTVIQRFLPQMAEHMLRTAPAGADITSWTY